MPNRRDFVKSQHRGRIGGGVLRGRPKAPRASRAKRARCSIGGRRVKVVDVHGHFIEPTGAGRHQRHEPRRQHPQQPERTARPRAGAHRVAWTNGASTSRRSAIRAAGGTGPTATSRAASSRFRTRSWRNGARRTRIGSSGWRRSRCSIPIWPPSSWRKPSSRLGLRGVGIAGHVAGEVPSSPKFDPFWAKAASSSACSSSCIPAAPTTSLKDGALRGRGDLGNIIGNPLETTVFLSRLIFDGTLDRFPRLKICGAHAGGYLPSYLGPHRRRVRRRARTPTARTRSTRANTSRDRSSSTRWSSATKGCGISWPKWASARSSTAPTFRSTGRCPSISILKARVPEATRTRKPSSAETWQSCSRFRQAGLARRA